jgi:hypothetical protein
MDHQEPHSTPRASPRIEVTIQSLHGIASNKSRDEWGRINDSFPRVTATIAFSGSASDMQVGSSTLCGTTGQLVIESKAAVIDTGALQSKHVSGLTAEWHEERSSANCGPHLTVGLQECDPNACKIPLPSINRDSRVVKEYDSDSVSISTIDTPKHSPQSRGGSAFWSNSGAAALPEIVELFVSLKTQDGSTDGQVWQGIAHLVVFGHEDDQGTFSMELPIKKPSHSELSTPNEQPDIFLTSEARLRVEVKVFPNDDERDTETNLSTPKIASSSSESHADVAYSRSMLDVQMEKLLEKIQKNEELAVEHVQNQKNAMDVNVPMEDDDHDDHPALCNGLWSWDRLWRTLSVVVQRCDEEAANVVAVSADNSDCSTIATRYSLDI